MRQRILARSTRRRSGMSGSTVASQYFVGLSSPLGHSMSSVSSAKRASPRIGAARTRTRAKRDRSFTLVPTRHATVRQARLGRLSANSSTLTRGGFGSSSRTGAHFDGRRDGGYVGEPQSREGLAQHAVVAVTSIHQHHTGSNARQQSCADLLQRN